MQGLGSYLSQNHVNGLHGDMINRFHRPSSRPHQLGAGVRLASCTHCASATAATSNPWPINFPLTVELAEDSAALPRKVFSPSGQAVIT